jgi:hypothetical protein
METITIAQLLSPSPTKKSAYDTVDRNIIWHALVSHNAPHPHIAIPTAYLTTSPPLSRLKRQ